MTSTHFSARRAALLLLALGGCVAAHAADPVRGRQLYLNAAGTQGDTCASCHGTDPTRNRSKILSGANNPTRITNAINNDTGGMGEYVGVLSATDIADIAAYIGNPAAGSGTPNASLAPASLAFTSTAVGATSATQAATLSNGGTAALSVTSISVGSADFVVSGGTCAAGGSVAAGGSCTVLLAFRPQAAGARSASLSIAHNATGSPGSVALSGTGLAGTLGLSATSLAFGAQPVNTTTVTQTVTVTNSGTASVSFTSFTLGGTNAADFSLGGGNCAVGTPLPASSSCTVVLGFRPTATGSRSGTLTIASNASNASVVISAGGTGTAAVAGVSPASVSFGSALVGATSATQTVTVSNSGTAALVLGTLSTGSSEFLLTGGTCTAGGSVAAGGSCTVILAFSPSAAGARSATLSITHNAMGSPTTVALSGTGTAATPAASVSPGTLTISQTVGGTSAPQTVTLSNTGTASLAVQGLTLGGTAAADYAFASGGTCTAGGSVVAGSSCTVKIAFTPSATGTRSANLTITHNAAGSPSSVALNGTGTAAPQAVLSVDQSALTFAAQAVTTTSAARTLTVSNTGSASLSISGLTLTGAQAADFIRAGTCAAGASVPVGSSCTVTVSYQPQAVGASSATLLLASNASNPSVTVGLSGSATAAPAPAVSLSPTSLSFGSVQAGATSATQTVTLTNSGTATLHLAGITATPGAFALTHTCGATLAPGANCQIAVSFTPAAAGAISGSLAVASNASGSPQTLALSGTGTAMQPPQVSWSGGVTAVDFAGGTTVGSSSSQVVTLVNAGPGTLSVQALSVQGANAGDFSLSSGCGAAPLALAAGSSCTITVSFVPGGAGPRSAMLGLVHDGQGAGSLPLTGQGIDATGITSPQSAGTTPLGGSTSNVGAGGCSIGRPDQPGDPLWAALALGAVAVLAWRGRTRRRAAPVPGTPPTPPASR